MARITITTRDAETFEVTVSANTRTVHIVTLSRDYYQRLTGGEITAEKLIEKSFEFLLARESNASILPRFELGVIARYFPEFEKTIVNPR